MAQNEQEKKARERRLSEMLDEDIEIEQDDLEAMVNAVQDASEEVEEEPEQDEGICVECEDHASQVFCEQCHDYFCILCYEGQHRKGNRTLHTYQPVIDEMKHEIATPATNKDKAEGEDDEDTPRKNICTAMGELLLGSGRSNTLPDNTAKAAEFLERAKYIPVRLTYEERKMLRALEAGLNVSTYTDKLDTDKYLNKGKRLRMQLQEVCGFLTGLVVATDYDTGQQLLKEKNFGEHEKFFQIILELGRRYKIINPERMRGQYGKLMYLLQDALLPEIQDLLGFSCLKNITTVHSFLEERDALDVLSDPDLETATHVVAPEGKSRSQIQREIKAKENAIKRISREYENAKCSKDDIQQCLYSIGDNNYHLYFERDPIDHMINYLQEYFDPNEPGEGHNSLAIQTGNDGARLSHSHERQYHYVLQSLTLWREIAHDMFRLWYLTDQDLLSPSSHGYSLEDTGQGLHRIQQSPRIARAMHVILHSTQRRLDHWVGSSVIHLGDKNVPNALMFIDKYAQVGHILRPIVKTLQQLDSLASKHKGMKYYIQQSFGGVEELRRAILVDFFREAFDGSGADNFFDAGSCIDGRLTSAWNWCSCLHNKPFYPVFKILGFIGFDGKFT